MWAWGVQVVISGQPAACRRGFRGASGRPPEGGRLLATCALCGKPVPPEGFNAHLRDARGIE